MKKRDDENITAITEIRTRAFKARVHPALVTAADTALAGTPVDRAIFLSTGQHQHLAQTLRTPILPDPDHYIADSGGSAALTTWSPGPHPELTWKIEPGLGDPGCYSFESNTRPNNYLVWTGNGEGVTALTGIATRDGSAAYKSKATWCVQEWGDYEGAPVLLAPAGDRTRYLWLPGATNGVNNYPPLWRIEDPQAPHPIDRFYNESPVLRKAIGKPMHDAVLDPDNTGYREYEKGRIYLSYRGANTWVGFVYNGPLLDKLLSLGGPKALQGSLENQWAAPDNIGQGLFLRRPDNTYLYIMWSPDSGAHLLFGGIGGYWANHGNIDTFGYPTTDEMIHSPDNISYFHFTRGAIYWLANSTPVAVTGEIHKKFAALGYEAGALGHPLSGEQNLGADGRRVQRFSGGAIYYTPGTGAVAVHGQVYDAYARLGYETGILGYPATDTTATTDGAGRFSNFTSAGGAIYFHPTTGAHAVYGDIRAKWTGLGAEKSFLGYPTSDEFALPNGRRNTFRNGRIDWSSEGGGTVAYSTTTVTAKTIQLKGVQSGRCLQVSGVGSDARADSRATELWDCSTTAPKQLWDLSSLGDNKYTLTNRNSGKCLNLSRGDIANGTPITQFSCHNGIEQQWEFTTAPNGSLALRNVKTGKVIDAYNSGTANGTLVNQWMDLVGLNQRWTLTVVQ
ncbi:RICIN domain-containing protein [Amycolatopsis sp. VS8301801F10]|uniref:RICIN domain-containing protein n=1 Tax=Amycolatopsis sp. VS8301801F10 TaxID=2652442 RepID=UPI0038FD02A9